MSFRLSFKLTDYVEKILALSALFALGPYFFWSTFFGGRLSIISSLFLPISAITIVIKGGTGLKISTKKLFLFSVIIIRSLQLILYSVSILNYGLGIFIASFSLGIILTADEEYLYRAYNYFVIIFIVFSLPSVLIYIFNLFGLDFPHTILNSAQEGKAALGAVYKNYGIGLIMDNLTIQNVALRPCGIFDEPGVIGTMSGLMVAPYIISFKKKGIKSKKFVLLMIVGIFSTSLAFVGIVFVTLILTSVVNKKKYLFFALILFIPIFYIFFQYGSNITVFSYIHSRIVRTLDSGILFSVKSSRGSDIVDVEFEKLKNDIIGLWFGKGDAYFNSINGTKVSYKSYIINYGIFGLVLNFLILIGVIRDHKKFDVCWILLIVFAFSMYQRVNVINLPHILILLGGTLTINRLQNNDVKST